MLSRLSVSNLAVVEKAEAEFAPGLNVLTGETGAGKSVVMGALGLVLGARADPDAVREGAAEARVEAEFDLSPAHAGAVGEILSDVGIEFDGGSLSIRRTVAAGGGRAWVNDSAATVSTLKRLGAILADVHGPRASQHIVEESFQRSALDSFGDISGGSVAADYAAAWSAARDIRSKLEALESETGDPAAIETLRYQIAEIEEASLSEEDESLAGRHAAAAHAEEIVRDAGEVAAAIGGDGGAADSLARVRPVLAALARHLPAAEEWGAELDAVTLRLNELCRDVEDAASAMDVSPDALQALDDRLSTVNRLKRRYLPGGGGVAELLGVLEEKRARLAELEGRGERIAALRRGLSAADAEVARCGAALGSARRAAAVRLGAAVTAALRDLGFLQASFAVSLEPAPPERHGCDRVTYVFGPNPGEPSRPLADVASSGEAARVMLALKSVLSEHDGTDVLVFDEIDANIGGEVGAAVGEKMRAVAASHQVIAITHLPQSAACADRHLVASKSVSGGRTRTRIDVVEGDARLRELSRMLGGGADGGAAAMHAAELLADAEGRRKSRSGRGRKR